MPQMRQCSVSLPWNAVTGDGPAADREALVFT